MRRAVLLPASLVALLLVLLPRQTRAQQDDSKTFARFKDTDIYCGNIGATNTPDTDACEAYCLQDPNCNGYTLVQDGDGNGGFRSAGTCYKKNYNCPSTGGWAYRAGFQSGLLGGCQNRYEDIPTNTDYSQCQNSDGSSTVMPTARLARRALARKMEADRLERQKLCPGTLMACPVVYANGTLATDSYECLSNNELNSCGGCNNDCESIPHATAVSCSLGLCEVHACEDSFLPKDGHCIRPSTAGRKKKKRKHQEEVTQHRSWFGWLDSTPSQHSTKPVRSASKRK